MSAAPSPAPLQDASAVLRPPTGERCFWAKSATFRWSCSLSCSAFYRNINFERVGGSQTIHSDVRVIAATHRNLAQMVSEKQFRTDLLSPERVPHRRAGAARASGGCPPSG